MADVISVMNDIWPIAVGFVTLVVILAKIDVRLAVVEDKIKTLFELWNKKD